MNDDNTRVEVELVRVYDAPQALVFRCMIEPAHLAHFWGPVGMSTPIENIEIDPRPGGVFNTTMVNDETGEEYPNQGVIVEIVEPSLLSFHEPMFDMLSTTTFATTDDGRTKVTIKQTNVPAMFASPEALAGFESSLDRCAAYLATLTA